MGPRFKARIIPQAGQLAAWILLALAAGCGGDEPEVVILERTPPGQSAPAPRPVPADLPEAGPPPAPPPSAPPSPGPVASPDQGPVPPAAPLRDDLAAWQRDWAAAPPTGWAGSRLPALQAALADLVAGSPSEVEARLSLAREHLRLGQFGEALAAAQAAVERQRHAWAAEIASGVVQADTASPAEWLPAPLDLTARAALWLALELEALAPGRPDAALWPPRRAGLHRDPLRAGTAAGADREMLALEPAAATAVWRLRLSMAWADEQAAPGGPSGAVALLTDLQPARPAGDLAPGDFDGDGIPDLMVARAGPGPGLTLLRGGSDGGFTEMAITGDLAQQPGATGLRPVDADADGDLDLLLLRAPSDDGTGAGPLSLLRRDSDRFRDVTEEAGLLAAGPGVLDAAWADADGDGDADLFLARQGEDLLLLQGPGWRWQPAGDADVAGPAGATLSARWADIDGDGDQDLHVIAPDGDRLWRNDGKGRFSALPAPLGRRPAPGPACFLDVDGDGDLDLLAVSGPAAAPAAAADAAGMALAPAWSDMRAVLRRNEGGSLLPWPGGGRPLPVVAAGALACGDMDGDGRGDAWVAADDQGRDLFLPHRLLRGGAAGLSVDETAALPVLPTLAALPLPAAVDHAAAVALLAGSRAAARPLLVLRLPVPAAP